MAQTQTRRSLHLDTRTWLEEVDALGELRRLDGLTWEDDIGRVTEMLHHTDEAPAVLFDNIPGFPAGRRILVNANGNKTRLGVTLGFDPHMGPEELKAWFIDKMENMSPQPVRYVDQAPILENVLEGNDVDVLMFPTPKWHEEDGGRYIGTGTVDVTKDPDSNWINLGTYRVMVHDSKRVGLYISPGKHGRQHRDKYFAKGEPMPVALIVGPTPALFVASSLEIAYGMSEYEWLGGLFGEPLEMIRGKHTGLPIPADAEIVLEGFAHPNSKLMEGPFGEWTGYYASGSREE